MEKYLAKAMHFQVESIDFHACVNIPEISFVFVEFIKILLIIIRCKDSSGQITFEDNISSSYHKSILQDSNKDGWSQHFGKPCYNIPFVFVFQSIRFQS